MGLYLVFIGGCTPIFFDLTIIVTNAFFWTEEGHDNAFFYNNSKNSRSLIVFIGRSIFGYETDVVFPVNRIGKCDRFSCIRFWRWSLHLFPVISKMTLESSFVKSFCPWESRMLRRISWPAASGIAEAITCAFS